MECIFCKIIKREIPSNIIYEDEYTMAFLDIAPVLPGHALVIPKKHVSSLVDLDDIELCHSLTIVKKVGEALKKSLGAKGYNINVNNGEVAGQIIDHFHWHVIPRQNKEELEQWPQGKYEDDEGEKIAKKIATELK